MSFFIERVTRSTKHDNSNSYDHVKTETVRVSENEMFEQTGGVCYHLQHYNWILLYSNGK